MKSRFLNLQHLVAIIERPSLVSTGAMLDDAIREIGRDVYVCRMVSLKRYEDSPDLQTQVNFTGKGQKNRVFAMLYIILS